MSVVLQHRAGLVCMCSLQLLNSCDLICQPDRPTAKQLLHASGVNKKNARKKKKLEKALLVLKVSMGYMQRKYIRGYFGDLETIFKLKKWLRRGCMWLKVHVALGEL